MNHGEWIMLGVCIYNALYSAWLGQQGKFLYWLGAVILNIGIIRLRG